MWPLKLSWPQCRPPNLEHLSRDRVPRGIVELCPCIKLTTSRKRTLLAHLHDRSQEQDNRGLRGMGTCSTPKCGPWWHECRAVYSTGVVDTKLHPYLLANGELGVVTEYTYNRNFGTKRPLLRLACPHCYYNMWGGNLLFHENAHRFDSPCKECVISRQCRYCSTRVIWASRPKTIDSSSLSTVVTERDLSDKFWKNQIIFPFPHHTKVLHPKSYKRSPGGSIEASFRWYNRWYLNPRLLLQVAGIRSP